VRWALSYYIDRSKSVEISWGGASIETPLPMPDYPPLKPYFDATAPLFETYNTLEYNPEKGDELGVVERVDVLPFHQMGRYKWEKLGGDYELGAVEAPSNEIIERVCATFRTHGLKTY
jgi:hypothetical protein